MTDAQVAGYAATPQHAVHRPGRPLSDVTQDELVAVVLAAPEPMSAREVRAALDIARETFQWRVTKLLSEAVADGRLRKTGRTTASRYGRP